MARKGFLVKVELDIQKITCPGVWLCSSGKVALQIHMLDCSVQTSSFKPIFPIHCYEKFVFYKTFYDHRLNELQRSLNSEWFYAEFVQIQNNDDGRVLAHFRTTLDDLLYPTSFRGSITGVDIDLLMEPTELFPGTLAPKLEVSTKTTVEETFCNPNGEPSNLDVVNPKFVLSGHQPQQRKCRPTRVCHSVGFSRTQKKIPREKKTRPIFQYRRVNDDLILRNNPNLVRCDDSGIIDVKPVCRCYCNLRSRSLESIPRRRRSIYRRTSPENMHRSYNKKCNCNSDRKCNCNSDKKCNCNDCPICSKYEGYFSSNCFRMRNCEDDCLCPNSYKPVCDCPYCKQDEEFHKNCDDDCLCPNSYKPVCACRYCRQDAKFHVRSTNGSLCGSDTSCNSDKKVCFCLPEGTSGLLARRLHEKLMRTLDSNRRFLDNCTTCQNVN